MGNDRRRRAAAGVVVNAQITARPATKEEAWLYLLRAAEFDTTGGTLTADECLNGSALSMLAVDGVNVAAAAITHNTLPR